MIREQNDGAPGLEPTYTLQQVAAYFNVTDKTVRRWIKRKIIRARRAGLRKYFFTRNDIDAVGRGRG